MERLINFKSLSNRTFIYFVIDTEFNICENTDTKFIVERLNNSDCIIIGDEAKKYSTGPKFLLQEYLLSKDIVGLKQSR